jgi:hypothetical protein
VERILGEGADVRHKVSEEIGAPDERGGGGQIGPDGRGERHERISIRHSESRKYQERTGQDDHEEIDDAN